MKNKEFEKRGLSFESGKKYKICYQGVEVGFHKIDLLVEDEILVELKTVERIVGKHYTQVKSYLKATGKSIGLLVNFADVKIDVRRVELEGKGGIF